MRTTKQISIAVTATAPVNGPTLLFLRSSTSLIWPPRIPRGYIRLGAPFFVVTSKGGQPIIEAVTVNVTNVVYFQELDPKPAPDPTASLTYLCFGKTGDLFAAHMITARPNFDQVLSVSLPDPDAAKMGFHTATPVEFARNDSDASRLREGEEADGWFRQSIGPHGEHGFRTEVRADAELYLEVGELE